LYGYLADIMKSFIICNRQKILLEWSNWCEMGGGGAYKCNSQGWGMYIEFKPESLKHRGSLGDLGLDDSIDIKHVS
jgi:hypothetical protein